MQRVRDSFFGARWHGRVPVGHLLWPDTLLYGTAINVSAAVVALLLFANDAPTLVTTAVDFAPLPYNLFLVAAVWKTTATTKEPWATGARIVALLWAAAVMII
jgi:hypothetical protein